MKFKTVLQLHGKTATGCEVPDSVVDQLGAGQRPPVRVTINGFTYRNTIAVMGGKYMLGVSAENRAGAGVAAGDKLTVEIELDDAPRVVKVPADFARALKKDAAAKKFFDGLSYSKRNGFVQSIEGAKAAETRQRRIAKSVAQLHDGRA